jgi:hypothetical protein
VLLLIALAQGADKAEYDREYGTRTLNPSELAALASEEVRVIETNVRVMGFGGTEPRDELQTDLTTSSC